MTEPDMLVVKLLWIFGFLLLFTIRSAATLPANIVDLNKDLADKYGKLLSALVSINEGRIDTMKKLHRQQELPILSSLRSRGQLYAVWEIEGKPAWLEKELQDNKIEYDNLQRDNIREIPSNEENLPKLREYSDIYVGFIENKKIKHDAIESDKTQFYKNLIAIKPKEDPRLEIILVMNSHISNGAFVKNYVTNSESSLEFWNDYKETITKEASVKSKKEDYYTDGYTSNAIVISMKSTLNEILNEDLFKKKSLSDGSFKLKNPYADSESSSIEVWKESNNGLSNDNSHIGEETRVKTNELSFDQAESSALEFWEGSKEILSKEGHIDANFKNHVQPQSVYTPSLLSKLWHGLLKKPAQEDLSDSYASNQFEKNLKSYIPKVKISLDFNYGDRPNFESKSLSRKYRRSFGSSVEFWKGSNETLSDENKQQVTKKSKPHIRSLQTKKTSKLIMSKEKSHDHKFVHKIDFKHDFNANKEISSLEVWGGSEEDLLNNSNEKLSDEKVKKNNNNSNKIGVPLRMRNSKVNKKLDLKPKRRYNRGRKKSNPFVKGCTEGVLKYCKKACENAFDYLCKNFKCTSFVKKNHKKECRRECKERFAASREDSSSKESDSTYERFEKKNAKLQKLPFIPEPFSWKKKPKHSRNVAALSPATLWR